MKLLKIKIENFRSIKDVTLNIEEVDGGNTLTLIGINESGKSSFLKAVSLTSDGDVLFPQDFFDDKKPISVFLTYQLGISDEQELRKTLLEKGFDKNLISKIKLEEVIIGANFNPQVGASRNNFERIEFIEHVFSDYAYNDSTPIKKTPDQVQEDFDLIRYFETNLPNYFRERSHRIVFWRSDNKYLINEPINLDQFAADPKNISIPLRNCFQLAGIVDIPAEISRIKTSPAETRNLQDKLGDKVTSHIKAVWPKHPIEIKFQIDSSMLTFLVEDKGVRYNTKTTSQRSDGFRQFISFLLTVSAESINDQLSNALLLLDEPETHLHPQAQEYLKDELIRITRNKQNNIVFFATHSNFMIDKYHIDRCFRVSKKNNQETLLERIEKQKSSYSEVNYEVFEVPTNDYHNELYGFLEDVEKTKLEKFPKTKKWWNDKTKTTDDVSLATYIRHSIHHPENSSNAKFTDDELIKSIKALRKAKYEIE